jgi:hypothetical protein
MGRSNCGKGALSYKTFFRKHIVDLPANHWTKSNFPKFAFYNSALKRGQEAIGTSTLFIVPEEEDIVYSLKENNEYGDVCNSSSKFDTFTCYRFGKEDSFSGCVSVGKCSPNYVKSTGKLLYNLYFLQEQSCTTTSFLLTF